MKTNFLVAILLASSTLLSAGTSSKLNLQIKNGATPGTIQIQLTAPDGTVRWEETINNQASFAKMIDLRALAMEPGRYDGQSFITYRHNLVDSNSMASSYTWCERFTWTNKAYFGSAAASPGMRKTRRIISAA